MFRQFFTTINSPRGRAAYQPIVSENRVRSVPPIDWYVNKAMQGDCITVMGRLPDKSIDAVITDPPYLVNFTDRTGRSYQNDNPNNGKWLVPAFKQMYRVLKDNAYCISFYGTPKAEWFLWAWREAGFRILEQIVCIKDYPSSSGHVQRHHELAFVLAKGKSMPNTLIPSVLEFPYSGNKHHPSEKPIQPLIKLVSAFSKPHDIVLDPFSGSFSVAIASWEMGRRFIGIELDRTYYDLAVERLREYKSNKQPYDPRQVLRDYPTPQRRHPRSVSAGFEAHRFTY